MGCFISLPRISIKVEPRSTQKKHEPRSTFATADSTEVSTISLETGRDEAFRTIRKHEEAMTSQDNFEKDEEQAALKEYLNRFVCSSMKRDSIVTKDIGNRENSNVRSKIGQRPLVDVQATLNTSSEIFSKIANFEAREEQSKESFGPSLEELHARKEKNLRNRCEKWKQLPPILCTM